MRIINKEEIDRLYKKANVSNTNISVSNKLNTGTMTNKLKHEMRAPWEKSESCTCDIKNEQIAQRIRYADIREGKRRFTELHKEIEEAEK